MLASFDELTTQLKAVQRHAAKLLANLDESRIAASLRVLMMKAHSIQRSFALKRSARLGGLRMPQMVLEMVGSWPQSRAKKTVASLEVTNLDVPRV